MRSEARLSPEAEHTVWWLLLCRAVERAARAAAFREAAEVCERVHDEHERKSRGLYDPYESGCIDTARELADALRARAESEAWHG